MEVTWSYREGFVEVTWLGREGTWLGREGFVGVR